MYRVTRTGPSIAEVIASARDIPERVIPYAASTAINRVLSSARADVRAEMPSVFDRPNAWTLNSLRVRTASRDSLSGSLDVKNDSPNTGTRPEDYLLPNVDGGRRKEKRFERNLRYAGILAPGHRAILGRGARLDAYGNLSRGEIQKILTAVKASFDRWQNRSTSRRSRKNAENAQYFVGGLMDISIVGGEMVRRRKQPHLAPGIYERAGRSLKSALIFTPKQPTYRKRLDVARIAEARVNRDFADEFTRAALAILTRRR